MSVDVNSISKFYGDQKALDQVTFHVKPGQITGFLGPNGAGKSTMMKIISCFIPQSEGSVKVNGHDINEEPVEVRRNVGYLPEHNPLYLDMYVKEFLGFIGGIHMQGKKLDARIDEMIEITGLTRERNKKIGALSKGYRQRTGLAQAMIHDPAVLILDEPTTGLDPNQLVEIRQLIRQLGKEKTLIFSTHIMQEVEAVCDRVIIINKGKIAADEKASDLRLSAGKSSLFIAEFEKPVNEESLKNIPGVIRITLVKANTWKITSDAKTDLRPLIFRFAVDTGNAVITLQKEENNLETVFRELTREK